MSQQRFNNESTTQSSSVRVVPQEIYQVEFARFEVAESQILPSVGAENCNQQSNPKGIKDRQLEQTSQKEDESWLGQYIPLHYHFLMLQDEDRVGAFRKSIQSTVRPGMHVVELGGGTGILSSFAAKMGARVTCVERNPELVRCARNLIERNGLSDSICVVQADAMEYCSPHPVDVVICEMLHVGLLREKQLDVIDSFKSNYLKTHSSPLPRFLPEASVLAFQPVEHSFDFDGYHAPLNMFQPPVLDHPRTTALGSLNAYAHILYDQPFEKKLAWDSTIAIEQDGCITALRFITQNLIAIDVERNETYPWPNQFLVVPLETPIQVRAEERYHVAFHYVAGDSLESLSRSIKLTPATADVTVSSLT